MRLHGVSAEGTWTPRELDLAQRFLSPLPPAWLADNPRLRAIIRQPVLLNAPPRAPGHSKYVPSEGVIVVYDKGVYHRGRLDSEQFRRSIFHELAHSILEGDPSVLERWSLRTAGDDFVDEYAKTNATEDFCDTFSEFLIFSEKTQRLVPRKWRFLYNLMQQAHSQEKVAMYFMTAFTDELTKVAGKTGMLRGVMNFMRNTASSGVGKAVALGTGTAVAGGAMGMAHGKRSGYDEATDDVGVVAQKALAIGREQGAQIGYQYAMQQVKASQ